jgi:O-antigen/teichoic acid export membrane protein
LPFSKSPFLLPCPSVSSGEGRVTPKPTSPVLNGQLARRLGGQTLYMIAGSAFTLIAGLPLQIYVSRTLGASGIGIFGLLEAGVSLAIPLLVFGIPQATVRFLPAHIENKEYRSIRRLLKWGAVILAASTTAAFAVTLFALPWFATQWPELAAYRNAAAIMAFMLVLGPMLLFVQQGLRGFQDIRYMVLGSSVFQLTVKVILTVGVFTAGYGVAGYVFATVASTLFALLWMSFGLRKRVARLPKGSDNPGEKLATWRRYAGISYFGNLVNALTARAGLERILLGIFAGPAAVGILVIVSQLQSLPNVFNQMLLTVGAPMMSAAHARSDSAERQHIYVLMTDWVVRVSLPLMLFLLIFSYEILALFGPEFAEGGGGPLRILIASLMFNIASGPSGNAAMMCGLEGPLIRFTAMAAVFRAILLVLLVPNFGLTGVAVTFAVEYVLSAAYTVSLIRRRLGMRWANRRFARWILPGAATIFAGVGMHFMEAVSGPVTLGLAFFTMYALHVGVSLIQGLHDDDKTLLLHIRNKITGAAA